MKLSLQTTIFLILFYFLSAPQEIYSQDSWWPDRKYRNEQTRIKYFLCKKAFEDIAKGFATSNINFVNLYFDSEVYVNLISVEKGYYSSNQAELILIEFMNYFPVNRVRYTRSHRNVKYAFAIGTYRYNRGGGNTELTFSISLKYKNNKWLVDQINIY